MSNAGRKVKVHYTGTLDDGTKFDSSIDRGEPLEFVCMAGQMIPGFDKAVESMNVGDTITVHLEPSEAYGERSEEAIQTIPLANIPGAEDLPVGETVFLQGPNGQPFPAKVAAMDDTTVTFDMNHELAGKPLNFEIELLEAE